jgi:hypothetical protein
MEVTTQTASTHNYIMTSVYTTMLDNLPVGTLRDLGILRTTVQWMLKKQNVSGLDSASSGWGPAVSSCEDGIESQELYDQLRDYQLQIVVAYLFYH